MRTRRMDYSPPSKKRSLTEFLDEDVLSLILSYLGLLDLFQCCLVSKSWCKCVQSFISKLGSSKSMTLEEKASKNHRETILEGEMTIKQWIGDTSRIERCRMRKCLIYTGVGSNVIRVWSSQNQSCVEEYNYPKRVSIVDFDFDDQKIVGVARNNIVIWKREWETPEPNVFAWHKGRNTRALAMRTLDSLNAIGCTDGSIRVFDINTQVPWASIRTASSQIIGLTWLNNKELISCNSRGQVEISCLNSNEDIPIRTQTFQLGRTTLGFNGFNQVFVGTKGGLVECIDIRMRELLWCTRIHSNNLNSLDFMVNDRSLVAVGGDDGMIWFLDQSNGTTLQGCENLSRKMTRFRKRAPILGLAVGRNKVVTTHGNKIIKLWNFSKDEDEV